MPERKSGYLTVMWHSYGRNAIEYSGGDSGTLTLTRTVTYSDGRVESSPVAGAVGVPGGQADVWVDGDVPFGPKVAEVTYSMGSSSVTVPSEDRSWSVLSDPLTGVSVSVVGASLGPKTWQSATSVTWLDVVVDGQPMVHARPEQRPTQTLSIYTTSRHARETVARLCSRRRPLVLRSPDAGVDDVWFTLAGERVEQRLSPQAADDPWRLHTWDLIVVERPDPATMQHVLHALGQIAAQGSTLGDLAGLWSTLGEMAVADIVMEHIEGLP